MPVHFVVAGSRAPFSWTLAIFLMYETHPHLVEPSNDTKLWRYMDFSKFLALLETRSLHMAALQSFEDPFEGHPPRTVIDAFTAEPAGLSPDELKQRKEVVENNLQMFKNVRNFVYASCWHMNPKESAGMWSQYIRSGEGIAVQTTFERLKASLAGEAYGVSGAVVQYVDFETVETKEYNVLAWGALKREEFEHEREFRLLALAGNNPRGFPVRVDTRGLIENIYLAPTTPDWIRDLVQAILLRYEYAVVPIRSELIDGPKYFEVPEWMRNG